MHAASVHPEPGSNSLKNSISTPLGVNTFFRASLTFLYFTLLGLCFLLEFSRSLTRYFVSFFVFHLSSCCSIFNDLRRSLSSDLVIILHHFAFVNTFSKVFSKLFLPRVSPSAVSLPRFCAALLVYHFLPSLSIGFLKVFSFFRCFCVIINSFTYNSIINSKFDQGLEI